MPKDAPDEVHQPGPQHDVWPTPTSSQRRQQNRGVKRKRSAGSPATPARGPQPSCHGKGAGASLTPNNVVAWPATARICGERLLACQSREAEAEVLQQASGPAAEHRLRVALGDLPQVGEVPLESLRGCSVRQGGAQHRDERVAPGR
eukprot:CAMPEP_0115765034 /NCGR_PEP_ID=MMETSP0272-20121206/102376_1 /TAXON_ID=71861 /ORGANISM="Scrippsiella trochoidea, Strain CCMP3099" /LENGTH=146 /DNA_ID=CAMNT_0003210857 /DNA_START=36 /DNA_END=477 /DNA_ORIENTATION=+